MTTTKHFITGFISGVYLCTKYDFTKHVEYIENFVISELNKIKKKS